MNLLLLVLLVETLTVVCHVYEKLRDADSYTIGDIYVAINAQYHDYCELFEKWFGSNFDEKIIASAVDFWFEDDDFDGNKVWKYFNEM